MIVSFPLDWVPNKVREYLIICVMSKYSSKYSMSSYDTTKADEFI